MNFCSACGARVQLGLPPGDDRQRYICTSCRTIHYQNPKIVAGAIILAGDRLLLCKRAIEPRWGTWTLPAGYMENGETIEEAARRESWEEAGAMLTNVRPYAVLNLTIVDQLYFIFLAQLKDGVFSAGEESLEVKLVDLADIPWDELSFPVIRKVMEVFVHDWRTREFPFRIIDAPAEPLPVVPAQLPE
jgi:ADP-ribose pyrophosphatase YjhB (NUDIX family)